MAKVGFQLRLRKTVFSYVTYLVMIVFLSILFCILHYDLSFRQWWLLIYLLLPTPVYYSRLPVDSFLEVALCHYKHKEAVAAVICGGLASHPCCSEGNSHIVVGHSLVFWFVQTFWF